MIIRNKGGIVFRLRTSLFSKKDIKNDLDRKLLYESQLGALLSEDNLD